MALALSLEITAETRQAEAGLQRVERGVESLSDKAKAADQRLEAAFKDLDQSIKTAEQSVSKMGRTQDGLTNAIVRFASGLAVGAAIKATISYADQINDLAAKAQISTTAMQKLAGAAEDNGSSISAVTNGMAELQRRLQSSDGGTIQALNRLNLNFEAIKRLQPDQAFLAVAGAMERSNQKNRDANELFGRLGRELLPILNAEFVKATDNQLAMSEAAVKAGATTNDIWNKVWRDMKTIGMEALGGIADRLNVIYARMQNALPFAQELARVFGRDFMHAGLTGGLYSMVRTGINPSAFASTMTSQALATLPSAPGAPSLFPSGLAVPEGDPQSAAVRSAIAELTGQTREAARSTRATAVAHARLAAEAERLAQAEANTAAALLNRPGYFQTFLATGSTFDAQMRRATDAQPVYLGGQSNPWGGIAQITGAMSYAPPPRPLGVSGGGFNWMGLLQTIGGTAGLFGGGSTVGQMATGALSGAAMGAGVSGLLSSMVGASVFGPLAPIAAVIGGAIPLIRRLFGPSRGAILGQQADARIAQTQQGLLQQFGSVENIRALGPYGAALADAWGSRNVQGEDWFNRLNKGLQEQLDLQSQIRDIEAQRKALVESLVPTWEQLTSAASRYGFDVNELGREVQQIGINATFKQIAEDLDLFGRATQDTGAYLSRMSGQISVAVQQALRFGTEVPENMRPFIENLRATGQLLDENGNAITDLSALRWGPAIQTQADIVREAIEKLNETFDALTQKLEDLFNRLANGLPEAAEQGARGANSALSGIEPPEWRAEGPAEGYSHGGPIYASRGLFIPRGTDTVPAMLTPGEFVMSSAATRRIGVGTLARMNRGESVGSGVSVNIHVAGYLDSQSARAHLASVVAAEIGRELRVRRRA